MTAVIVWLALALLAVGTIVDLRRREIPDGVPAGLLALALVATARSSSAAAWLAAGGGLVSCLAAGTLLWRLGAFGGGDVKVLAALGALVGVPDVVTLLTAVALAGGGLALVAAVRGEREFAYGPAIAAGFAAFVYLRGLL